ncbi:hypothetical protein BDA96_03G439600 [Sorghum bicolor]|uniref:Uncharacterized protein n=2 Tax=Sorghum bicolor TaxID=4558 RepID=A0A921RI98_SORBI|nr:hypothetical protein BDA96_03G439600 [Sorghum bicolor]KXG34015.1 hypothetical protein SORBI_3003G407500 [Sorghum bicolor]
MDSGASLGRRGKGEKGRGRSRLGMKTALSPSPPAPPAPPSAFQSAPPARPSSSPSPAAPTSSPAPAPVVPASSPTGQASSPPQGVGLPPMPPQEVRLGALPPNFSSEQGNQHAPNFWIKRTM